MTQDSSHNPSDQSRLGTERDSARRSSANFPDKLDKLIRNGRG